MIRIRAGDDRGTGDHGAIRARYSFSFAGYEDPEWMGFGALRVLNEDRIAPGAGFPPHPHRDIEIITYILSGALWHRDSLGGNGILHAGGIQVMSAGAGIEHAEMNASQRTPLHLLQIWIAPDRRGGAPHYAQGVVDAAAAEGRLLTLVAPAGAPFSVRQDARVAIGRLHSGMALVEPLRPGRRQYLHVVRGAVALGDRMLAAGDAALLVAEDALSLSASGPAEVMLFDLA